MGKEGASLHLIDAPFRVMPGNGGPHLAEAGFCIATRPAASLHAHGCHFHAGAWLILHSTTIRLEGECAPSPGG